MIFTDNVTISDDPVWTNIGCPAEEGKMVPDKDQLDRIEAMLEELIGLVSPKPIVYDLTDAEYDSKWKEMTEGGKK